MTTTTLSVPEDVGIIYDMTYKRGDVKTGFLPNPDNLPEECMALFRVEPAAPYDYTPVVSVDGNYWHLQELFEYCRPRFILPVIRFDKHHYDRTNLIADSDHDQLFDFLENIQDITLDGAPLPYRIAIMEPRVIEHAQQAWQGMPDWAGNIVAITDTQTLLNGTYQSHSSRYQGKSTFLNRVDAIAITLPNQTDNAWGVEVALQRAQSYYGIQDRSLIVGAPPVRSATPGLR